MVQAEGGVCANTLQQKEKKEALNPQRCSWSMASKAGKCHEEGGREQTTKGREGQVQLVVLS